MENKINWIKSVMESAKGMHKAKPSPDLFSKIENSLLRNSEKIIPLKRLKLIAAAAVFLFAINFISIQVYFNKGKQKSEHSYASIYNTESLFIDYSMYPE